MKKGVIEIENMKFYAFHGCYKEEQIVGNYFNVSLKFSLNISRACESDDISDTVSYLEVYELIKEEMGIKSHILENVAMRILNKIKQRFSQIEIAEIKISKLQPPLGGDVGSVSVCISL